MNNDQIIVPKIVSRTKTSCIVHPYIPFYLKFTDENHPLAITPYKKNQGLFSRNFKYTDYAVRLFKDREKYTSENERILAVEDLVYNDERAVKILPIFLNLPSSRFSALAQNIRIKYDYENLPPINYDFVTECRNMPNENLGTNLFVRKGYLNLVYVLSRSIKSERKVFLGMIEYFYNLIYGLSKLKKYYGTRGNVELELIAYILLTPRDIILSNQENTFQILNFENLIEERNNYINPTSSYFKPKFEEFITSANLYYFLPPELFLCKLAFSKRKEIFELTNLEIIESIHNRNDNKSYMSFMKKFEKNVNFYFNQKFRGKFPIKGMFKKPDFIGNFFKQTLGRYQSDLIEFVKFARRNGATNTTIYTTESYRKKLMPYNLGMLIAYSLNYGFNESVLGGEKRDFIRYNNDTEKIYKKVFSLLSEMLIVDPLSRIKLTKCLKEFDKDGGILDMIKRQEESGTLYVYHRTQNQRIFDFIGRNFNRVKGRTNYIIQGINRNFILKPVTIAGLIYFIIKLAKPVGGNILLPVVTGQDLHDFKEFFRKKEEKEEPKWSKNPAKQYFFIPGSAKFAKFILNMLNTARKLGWKAVISKYVHNPFSYTMLATILTLMIKGDFGKIYLTEEARINAKQEFAPNTFSPRRNANNTRNNNARGQPEDFSEFD